MEPGASIATVVAETAAMVVQFRALKHQEKEMLGLLKESLAYLLIGIVMVLAVRAVALIEIHTSAKLVLEIAVGGILYIIGCAAYWKMTDNLLLAVLIGKNKKGKQVYEK